MADARFADVPHELACQLPARFEDIPEHRGLLAAAIVLRLPPVCRSIELSAVVDGFAAIPRRSFAAFTTCIAECASATRSASEPLPIGGQLEPVFR